MKEIIELLRSVKDKASEIDVTENQKNYYLKYEMEDLLDNILDRLENPSYYTEESSK